MKPDSTAVVRLVAVSDIDSTGEVAFAPESRTAFCAGNGSFELGALPTDGKEFRLWAFTDRNSDARYSSQDEFSTVLEDTFRLTPAMTSISNLEINIIDPNEPGNIEGRIIDLTGFGIPPSARFEPLFEDGKVQCGSCHYAHGSRATYGMFLRVDNTGSALCMTCHIVPG